jgi:hypothetical protein
MYRFFGPKVFDNGPPLSILQNTYQPVAAQPLPRDLAQVLFTVILSQWRFPLHL